MAATVSSPWGKPGAWALDSEEHEAELRKDHHQQQADPTTDFPSLAVAATTKPKKKKNQPVSLAEFATYGGPKPSAPPTLSKGRTHEDLLILPTGPRERTAEELERARFGSRNYPSSNRHTEGDDSSNSRWGSSRGFDDTRKNGGGFGSRDSMRELAPSRADETDNWASGKKPIVGNGFERKERGFFSDSHSSKADESDSWVSNKSSVPSEGWRFGSGGGFERERRGGGFGPNGGGADSDNWGKKKDEDSVGRGSDRPRLNLQPRKLPVSNEKPGVTGAEVKPKGSNPFGEARPREEVLAEKGQDWKKIDEQLESMKIKEPEKSNGTSFGKRGFGSGHGWGLSDSTERSWRKQETPEAEAQARPHSAENTENGPEEEN